MNFLKKIDTFYLVTLLFLLLSSNANFLAANNLFWFASIITILSIAIIRKAINKKEGYYLGIFALVYLGGITLRDIYFNNLEIDYWLADVLVLFKYPLLAYAYVVLLKEKTIDYLVKVTVHLAAISLFFYFLQLIGLEQTLYHFSTSLNLPHETDFDEGYTNFIIFTLTLGRHDFANSGFVWEPGSYGCFLVIILTLHLFSTKFKFDGKAVILLITIVTTFSTTCYLGTLFMLWLAYRYRVPKLDKWVILIIAGVVVLFITVPFLGNKIVASYNEDTVDLKRLNVLEKWYHKLHYQVPLGRFSSMQLIYDRFKNQLIFGVSNRYDVLLNKKDEVNISNGIFDFMARFGLVTLVFLFFRFLQFCNSFFAKIKLARRIELLVYCGIILFVLAFGEPILVLPVVLMFIFLPLETFNKRTQPGGFNPEITNY